MPEFGGGARGPEILEGGPGVWGRSSPEAEAFCLNRYKILSLHGIFFLMNPTSCTVTDSISLCQL